MLWIALIAGKSAVVVHCADIRVAGGGAQPFSSARLHGATLPLFALLLGPPRKVE